MTQHYFLYFKVTSLIPRKIFYTFISAKHRQDKQLKIKSGLWSAVQITRRYQRFPLFTYGSLWLLAAKLKWFFFASLLMLRRKITDMFLFSKEVNRESTKKLALKRGGSKMDVSAAWRVIVPSQPFYFQQLHSEKLHKFLKTSHYQYCQYRKYIPPRNRNFFSA